MSGALRVTDSLFADPAVASAFAAAKQSWTDDYEVRTCDMTAGPVAPESLDWRPEAFSRGTGAGSTP